MIIEALIILFGIGAIVLSTVVSAVVAFWLIYKVLDYMFGK